MTEEEFMIEMLCCLPKELLIKKLKGDNDIPDFLITMDDFYVHSAIEHYEDTKYVNVRENSREE